MTKLADMHIYERYQDSQVEFAGRIPKHWKDIPIRAIFEERNEKNIGPKTDFILSVTRDRGVIPYDEKGAIGNNKSEDIQRYKVVHEDDLVINKMNVVIGSLGLSKYHGALSQVYIVLKPKNDLFDIRYYTYLFHNKPFYSSLIRYCTGIMELRESLDKDEFKKVYLPFPPKNEQNGIANFLDQKTAQIDQAIAIKEQQINLLKERKQILIQQAVTRGLNPNVPMRDSGVDWIGDIPEHWEVKRLKHVAGRFMYGTSVDCNTLEDGTPVLRIPNIKEIDFCFDDLKFAKLPTEETSRYRLSAGDVLIIRTNGNPALVGKSALFEGDGDYLFASYLIRLKPKNNVLPQFLVRAMNSFSVRGALTHSARTSVGNYNLNTQALGDCAIAVPPLEEQRNIVAYLKEQNRKFEATVGNQTVQIEKLKEYKTTLINSAVTGKIKVA